MQRLMLAVVAMLALIVAACSAPAEASPEEEASLQASVAPSEEASEEPSEDAAESAEASASDPDDGSAGLPGSAPELEDALPDEAGGITLQKFSMRGAEFMAQGDDNQEFLQFLDRMDAQPDDLSVAFAFGAGTAGESLSVFAFRVEGADTDQLTDELRTSLEEEGTAANLSETKVAGKDVLVGESADESTPGEVYLYGVGDIVFFIGATERAHAEEVLSQLP